jgi:hypothetical protein
MTDIFPLAKQRPALLALRDALGCRDNALRRDECGDWRIVGKLGHVYAVPGSLDRPKAEGFQIYFRGSGEFEEPPRGSPAWSYVKKAMAFCEVTNDGDGEGMMFLDRLPTAAEAEIIRDKLGIAKKREVSAAERERLLAMSSQYRFAAQRDVVGTPDGAPGSPSAPSPGQRAPDPRSEEIGMTWEPAAMTKPDDKLSCRSCERELAPGDVREAFVRSSLFPEGEVYGPLCAACAEPAHQRRPLLPMAR